MPVLYILLTTLIAIFTEVFLVALCNFRFFYVLNIALFKKISWKYMLIFSVVGSVALDVIYHYTLGTNLLLIGISLLLLMGISLIVPYESNLPGYSVKFVCIFLYYLSVAIIPTLIASGQWTAITGLMIGGMVIKSLASVAFCLVFDWLWSRLRKKDEGTKLRSL